MSAPLPPEIILPDGRPAYLNPYKGTYTTSRSYARRMQANYARGISQSEARGHRQATQGPFAGMSEAQRRRVQAVQAGYQTPFQRFAFTFEQRWGFSYRYWRKLRRRYIDYIMELDPPAGPNGLTLQTWRIIVSQDLRILREFMPPWAVSQRLSPEQVLETRFETKIEDMIEYREGDKSSGNYHYFVTREGYRPVELWWYH